MNARSRVVERDCLYTSLAQSSIRWDNGHATLTANKVARATAAKRSSGLTITNEE